MKTTRGEFARKYSHIDAPTHTDNILTKQVGRRLLANPKEQDVSELQAKIWREPELAYLADATWFYKRKLNGENIRIFWDGEKAVWNGKTNDFVCKPETEEYMSSKFPEEIFEERFGRKGDVYIFGERMGPKVQGNELGLTEEEFVLFDVCIGGFWLEAENLLKIADYFGVKTCYDFMPRGRERAASGELADTLSSLIDRICKGEFQDWEGIVAHPGAGLLNRKGERIITKIKNHEYLR